MFPLHLVVPVRFGFLFLLLVASLPEVFAGPPPGYYATAEGKVGLELKQALHDIIDAHTVLPYSSSAFDTHDALDALDEDPANTNNVLLIYSRRSEPKSSWPDWNREHLWPNSLGLDDALPAYSDLHNLRACDLNVNSSRGNEYYDWSDTSSPSYLFPAHPEAPECSSDTDSWEPPASVKGDIARSQFYMAVRYAGDSGEPDLELVQDTALINSSAAYMGRLSSLIEWHRLDPVDAAEQQRHEGVYGYQNNRNPFVDHPEWVDAVFLPVLQVQATHPGLRLRWENGGVQFQVEWAPGPAGPWSGVLTSPVLDAEGWYLDVSAENLHRFYRLKL